MKNITRQAITVAFIWQRILRLFPAYLCVLLLTVVVEGILSVAAGTPVGAYKSWIEFAGMFSGLTWFSLVCSNLFLVGQQVILYQAVDPATGHFYFTGQGWGQYPASSFLFIALRPES